MKFYCKWCKQEIPMTQAERQNGFKKLKDHESECFGKTHPNFGRMFSKISTPPISNEPVPDKHDMKGIIGYLHKKSGRIPTENECLRFAMFLNTFQTKPLEKECNNDFLRLLEMMK